MIENSEIEIIDGKEYIVYRKSGIPIGDWRRKELEKSFITNSQASDAFNMHKLWVESDGKEGRKSKFLAKDYDCDENDLIYAYLDQADYIFSHGHQDDFNELVDKDILDSIQLFLSK